MPAATCGSASLPTSKINSIPSSKMIRLSHLLTEIAMSEGLGVSHDVDKAVTLMNRLAAEPHKIKFSKLHSGGNRFKMETRSLTLPQWENIIKLANNLGWYPINYQSTRDWFGRNNYYPANKQKFVLYVNRIGNGGDVVSMYFDSKYDWEIKPAGIAYHTTPEKYKDKILKVGLTPRSKEKFGQQPARIYLAYKSDPLVTLIKHSAFYPNEKTFVIFEVDISSLISKGVKFYSDPSWEKYGFYTYHNIPPQSIKVHSVMNKKGQIISPEPVDANA